jgi:putative heme-binding domain-containing protein
MVSVARAVHRFHGDGYAVGPDLESVAGGGKEKLLTHLVDPNREGRAQFAAYVAELADGVVLSGVLAPNRRTPSHARTARPRNESASRASKADTNDGRSPMPEAWRAAERATDG